MAHTHNRVSAKKRFLLLIGDDFHTMAHAHNRGLATEREVQIVPITTSSLRSLPHVNNNYDFNYGTYLQWGTDQEAAGTLKM